MAYPPALLPTDRINTTATPDTHPDDHNNANGAVNDIVDELGAAPAADSTDVEARLESAGAVGRMVMFGGDSAPDGWLLCDGSEVSRTTYADLFGAVGTTFGGGNGSSTFNLPNLQGRIPVGDDGSTYNIGDTGGQFETSITTAHMATHNHGVTVDSDSHSHSVGTLAVAFDSHSHLLDTFEFADNTHSHTAGALEFSSNDHVHGAGAIDLASVWHDHDPGSLSTSAQDTSHSHAGSNLSTSSPSHSHTSGNISAASHTHPAHGFATQGDVGNVNWGLWATNMNRDRAPRSTGGPNVSSISLSGNTSSPSHAHTVSSNTGGINSSHSHSMSLTAVGDTNHDHGFLQGTGTVFDDAGEHSHSVDGNSEDDAHVHTSSSGSTASDSHSHAISGNIESGSHDHTAGMGDSGSGNAHDNRQPYLVFQYIIKI